MSVKSLKTDSDKVKGIEEWRSVISRYQASGLPQKQFCVREGISFGTFKTWLYRLKSLEVKVGDEPTTLFTPIVVTEELGRPIREEPHESSLVLELCGDMRIVVGTGFGATTLRRLIQVVRGLNV